MSVLDRTDGILDRMKRASDKVEDRLDRAATALAQASVPYVVVGGNAVAAWVATVDEGAVRMTRDVDMMLRRQDFGRARAALESAGFTHRHSAGMDMFLDTPESKASDAVHLIFANERVRADSIAANPDVEPFDTLGGVRYLALESLVRIKLTAWRDKDRTHLRDMIGVGLIDESWVAKLPDELGRRLQQLLDDPEG